MIIFIITRPLLEGSVDMQLPQNMGKPDTRTLTATTSASSKSAPAATTGCQGRLLPLAQLEGELVRTHRENPRLIVDIRADKRTPMELRHRGD